VAAGPGGGEVMSSNVIVLEFNELTPAIMERMIAAGELPNFARLRAESIAAITDAAEEPPALEPWIQWVTVHTGLSYAQHGVFDLDDARKLAAPRIWDVVSNAGRPVWVCGSMNATATGPLNGWLLPDPWASGVRPQPARLEPFFRLVQTFVREHASAEVPLSPVDYARFAAFMAGHGLSARTLAQTLGQLSSEKGGANRWRRAAILDRLQWDLFRAGHRRLKPAFATFFSNSTAHYQHYHWREMEPGRFKLPPSAQDLAAYADAIPFGYRRMDALVGEALEMAGPDTTLVLCTALSQQPLLQYEDGGGKQVFKPRDAHDLLRFAGVAGPFEYAPVMAEEFHLRFPSDGEAEAAERALSALRLEDGAQVVGVRRDEAEMMVTCNIIAAPPAAALVRLGEEGPARPFHELYFPLGGLKSGRHHPDGLLWIRTPERRHVEVTRKVSLLELAPTFLALCGLPPSPAFAAEAMAEVVDGRPIQTRHKAA
jgi:hypothetical protein